MTYVTNGGLGARGQHLPSLPHAMLISPVQVAVASSSPSLFRPLTRTTLHSHLRSALPFTRLLTHGASLSLPRPRPFVPSKFQPYLFSHATKPRNRAFNSIFHIDIRRLLIAAPPLATTTPEYNKFSGHHQHHPTSKPRTGDGDGT